MRQTVVLARRLTLQFYGQLFSAYEGYGPFYGARARGTAPIRPADLLPAAAPTLDPSGHTSALVLNAVLRWEYRPGSTLFVVYARSQSELPLGAGVAVPRTLAARALGPGPTTDSLLVKWSYYVGP